MQLNQCSEHHRESERLTRGFHKAYRLPLAPRKSDQCRAGFSLPPHSSVLRSWACSVIIEADISCQEAVR